MECNGTSTQTYTHLVPDESIASFDTSSAAEYDGEDLGDDNHMVAGGMHRVDGAEQERCSGMLRHSAHDGELRDGR